ncbi:MAG TPA: hypothetical protein VLQ67_07360, partial [Arachnia sp.]|nr:hypothetical protein [Arachnia sp.]
TWLYSHPDEAAGNAALLADPRYLDLRARMAGHVFGNLKIRPVDVEIMTELSDPAQLAIMRRYSITGSWDEFLAIWRRIVTVRERHGFPCLFAVVDRPENMFTWAFGFDGEWADFPAAQRPYYQDPERIELRGVFDYMADYDIHPARQLHLPGTEVSPIRKAAPPSPRPA